MELTDEQRERIRKNRERALSIRKKRAEALEAASSPSSSSNAATIELREKKRQRLEGGIVAESTGAEKDIVKNDKEEVELEDFEVGASDYCSKEEAKKTYCLPDGTLAVCAFVEKENPHHKSWKPMKLYYRSEIRRRARDRFGGLEGLISERKKREEKRFRNDLEKAKELFK